MRNHLELWTNPSLTFARDWFGFSPVLDRLFEEQEQEGTRRVHSSGVMTPACDVEESEGHFLIALDMPGISKEDIRIETKGDQLVVTAERKHESEKRNGSRFVSERSYGKFYRAFSLGQAIDRNKIEAVYKDGVLRIALAKAEETKPKQIQVNSEDSSGTFEKLSSKGSSEKKLN